jgi:hypothetical protein
MQMLLPETHRSHPAAQHSKMDRAGAANGAAIHARHHETADEKRFRDMFPTQDGGIKAQQMFVGKVKVVKRDGLRDNVSLRKRDGPIMHLQQGSVRVLGVLIRPARAVHAFDCTNHAFSTQLPVSEVSTGQDDGGGLPLYEFCQRVI